LDIKKVEAAFLVLKKEFGKHKQKNILSAIELQFQERFIEKLFERVLGYVRFEDDDWNIRREQDSESSSERADAAIMINQDDSKIMAVMELKSSQTHDLQRVEEQGFKYFHQHQPLCRYVITSNFQMLRLYVNDNQGYEQFDLFKMADDTLSDQFEHFKKLYLLLNPESILKQETVKLREATIQKEKEITDKLYTHYKIFRLDLHKNLQKDNKKINKFDLFKKTQKLIDRFLFIFFAEDKGLLPAKTVETYINNWEKSKKGSLLDAFKLLFNELNKGNDSKGIFAYSGGLFEPDAMLDSLTLDDSNMLKFHLNILQLYDFKSDIDVNILGHIFEHSLNDMDEMKALSDGKSLEKSATKRKKEGVFYTPQYITRYIVENTIGALCREKERELGIMEGKTVTKKQLNEYREWLFSLTVIDPACGSGAFLNAALDFFIRQHERIDERMAGVNNAPIEYLDYCDKILKNNIFGVDLNEEAVEIAKLSLWLRTAKQGQKLTNLNDNIKVGNSLISDPSVSDAAFKWKTAFKPIFDKGGFDVVIGNPPYGASFNNEEKDYLKKEYEDVHITTTESYNYFISKILKISNRKSIFGVIIPSSFLNQIEFEKARRLLLDKSIITRIINLGDSVFDDVATPTCIVISDISKMSDDSFYADFVKEDRIKLPNLLSNQDYYQDATSIKQNEGSVFIAKNNQNIIQKCYKFPKLKEIAEEVATGVSSGLDKAYVFTKTEVKEKQFEKQLLKKMVIGGEINRYFLEHFSDKFLIYITSEDKISSFPNIEKELKIHKDTLLKRREAANGKINWYALNWARRKKLFEEPKILVRQTANKIMAAYDDQEWYCLKSGLIIQLPHDSKLSYRYLLAILNSKLMDFLYQDLVNEGERIFPEVKPVQLFKLPIVVAVKEKQIKIEKLVEILMNSNNNLIKLTNDFLTIAYTRFASLETKRSLETWYDSDWKAFDGELKKQKCILLPKEQTEWQPYFEQERRKIQAIQATIQETDAAIDALVYGLYGLTKEEIRIVEQS
jgi:type I restriction-modification system DNA methylase subunit